MNNVFFNKKAIKSLNDTFTGLVQWNKGGLDINHALEYVNDIKKEAQSLVYRTYHSKTVTESQMKYGEYVYIYKRNKSTQWFIVYDRDSFGNIFINNIFSNHTFKTR